MMTLLRYYRKNGPSLRMLEEPNSLRKTMSISLTRKVDFPMLDLAGIAYFPRIYDLAHRFFEDAWLEICGFSYPHIINEMKIGFPVVDIQTKFIQPLKYGDEITARIWISNVGNKSCTWEYKFYNQNQDLLWSSQMVNVCVSMSNMESMAIPEELRKGLEECSSE